MMRIEWTDRARWQLVSILEYIGKDNIDAALKVDESLNRAAESLLDFPRKGHPGEIAGTREIFVKPRYRLIYIITEDTVLILSVLHTSQDYPASLDDI